MQQLLETYLYILVVDGCSVPSKILKAQKCLHVYALHYDMEIGNLFF